MPIVQISDLSWGGEGIGRIKGKVVFVPYTLPGEVTEVELVRSKKNYSQGHLIRLLETSPKRIEPPCTVYHKCGGCQLQHLSPHSQIQEKEKLFRQTLTHVLRDNEISVKPTLASPLSFGYRHRLNLKSAWKDNRFILGFFRADSHEVVQVTQCLLANQEVNKVLLNLQEIIQRLHLHSWAPEIELQFFGNPPKGGLVFSCPQAISTSQKKKIKDELLSSFKLNYLLFQDSDLTEPKSLGPFSEESDCPEYELPLKEGGLSQNIILTCFPGVFSQINLDLNQKIMIELVKMDLFNKQDRVFDIYCGLGNFSLPVSLLVRDVVGIEASPRAVANAKWNQKRNRVSNCAFVQGKAQNSPRHLRNLSQMITKIILDPPRNGAKEVISWLENGIIEEILYISCNPMTLFRDLKLFIEKGWRIEWTQPIDFFPQTYHLESMTLLRKP